MTKSIKKVAFIAILLIFTQFLQVKPINFINNSLGFISNSTKKIISYIYNPVELSINQRTANFVTQYVNKDNSSVEDGYFQRFNVVDFGRSPRVHHYNLYYLGNGEVDENELRFRGDYWSSERPTFFSHKVFLNIAKKINRKELQKLIIAVGSSSTLVASIIYFLVNEEVTIQIHVFKTAIVSGLSFSSYFAYKFFKEKIDRIIDINENGSSGW